jgi:8-oxo-dGTP diphosphatase
MLRNNQVLLMHRVKNGKEYWTFPGGGVEKGETIEQAVVREIEEETCLETVVEKLLYVHHYETSDQYFFLCNYISGEPVLGNSVEMARMARSKNAFYEPIWEDIENLPSVLLYPLEIRDWLLKDLKNGFAESAREITLSTANLRQELL